MDSVFQQRRRPAVADSGHHSLLRVWMVVAAVAVVGSSLWYCGCIVDPRGGTTVAPYFILSYNVENLFDDQWDGTEYSEYDPRNGAWTTDDFHAKLRRLAGVIQSVGQRGPDLVLLQEVENQRVIEMLLRTYLRDSGYHQVVMAPLPGASVNVAAVSRLPVASVRSHHLETDGSSAGRLILEFEVEVHGRSVVVFNNHWKSKFGGAAETEPLRVEAAGVVVRRIRELLALDPHAAIVVAGDLNAELNEFETIDRRYQTALLPLGAPVPPQYLEKSLTFATDRRSVVQPAARQIPTLFSPWLETIVEGSYVFQNTWERIDHLFVSAAMVDGHGPQVVQFDVVYQPILVDRDGYPLRWERGFSKGLSDHLPLLMQLGPPTVVSPPDAGSPGEADSLPDAAGD